MYSVKAGAHIGTAYVSTGVYMETHDVYILTYKTGSCGSERLSAHLRFSGLATVMRDVISSW